MGDICACVGGACGDGAGLVFRFIGFSEGGRAALLKRSESSVEMRKVVEAYFEGDFCDGPVCRFEEFFCLDDPDEIEVVDEGRAGDFSEEAAEVIF